MSEAIKPLERVLCIALLTDDTVGTTLEHESDDVTVGGIDFGWVKTYAFLPEDRVGSRRRENSQRELKNEPSDGILSYVDCVRESSDEGHEAKAQGKSLEKREHQDSGRFVGKRELDSLLFIFSSPLSAYFSVCDMIGRFVSIHGTNACQCCNELDVRFIGALSIQGMVYNSCIETIRIIVLP